MRLSKYLQLKIRFIYLYIQNVTVDWFKIKRELLNNINNKQRKRFTTRHPKSKKHSINRLEREVIKFWKQISGNDVYIDPLKLHDKKHWNKNKHKTRGWKLKEINEKRKQDKNKTTG